MPYRDPMTDPYMQAAADALAAREARERARDEAWQEGHAEALQAIDAFNRAVAPACLQLEHGRAVADMRTARTTVLLARGEHRYSLAWVAWNGDGWIARAGDKSRTFESILLEMMQNPEFADALAKMQDEDFADSVTPPTPVVASSRRSTVTYVVGSLVLALLLALVVTLPRVFPALFG